MGFAYYLRRHPNSSPTGENIDKNHVINTITALQYTLHTAHRKRTNQNARNRNTHNDVINRSNPNKTKLHVFCILHATKQPPSFVLNKLHNKQLFPTHINQNNLISKIQLDPLFNNKNTCLFMKQTGN